MSNTPGLRYTIHRAIKPPSIAAEVGTRPAGWERAEVGQITRWHDRSGAHRPRVYFRALHDRHSIYVRFDVMDRHVRCIHGRPQSNVCEDSCVEFFVQPAPGNAYFNFEISAAGTPLLYFIEDARRRRQGGFRKYRPVAPEWLRQVEIGHSLPGLVRRPVAEPLAWAVAYRIPLALFTAHLGVCGVARGDVWHGNFFKCGGDPDFGHWGMWSDVGGQLNFHQPEAFGELIFG